MRLHPVFVAFGLMLLLVYALPVVAQRHTFNRVLSPYGNFSTIVGGIAQDKSGYMWFASGRGLYRYDGYQFKMYTNDPTDSNSIFSNRLETVYPDSKGTIWIATWINGIDRLDPATGKFTHYKHDPTNPESLSSDSVKCFLEDRDGNLWVGTNKGIDKFDPATGKFKNYRHNLNDPNTLSCNHTRRIYEDKAGTIWVATGTTWGEGCQEDEGGLNRFDKTTGRFIRYLHDPKDPTSLINNKIQGIFEDSRGTFWIGSAGDGLHTMDREKGTFERHLHDPSHPEKLSRPPLQHGTFTDHITFITEDVLGGVWIGTLGNGVNYYDPKSGQVTHYVNENTDDGFTANGGWTYYNSREGVLWIGTFQGNLFRMDPFHKKIPHINVDASVGAIIEDDQNNLWIGTDQGLIRQNKLTGSTKKFTNDESNPSTLSNNVITTFLRDKDGTLWIGTAGGLNRFNSQSNTFTRYLHNPNDPASIMDGRIFALEDGGSDSLWIGGTNGLNLMNKRTGEFTLINGPSSESLKFIVTLLNDDSRNLWIGTYGGGGLYKYDPGKSTFEHYLKGKFCISLTEDSEHKIWAGTEGEGVYWIRNSDDVFTNFTDFRTGIEDTGVGRILEDNQQNLWLNTVGGIFKINLLTNQSFLYGLNEGIRVGNLNYLSGARGQEGEIYFGDANGYYVIASDQLLGNPNPPQVIISDFRIGEKAVLTATELELKDKKSIALTYDQNGISISFAGIHYSNPNYNRHQYMLENYDQEWREAGFEKTANYFNVPPGQYVFTVKASSNEGVWAENQITITITPPWWRSWWAYGIYGLLFIGGIYGVDRFQRQAVIRTERERAQVRELAQAKEIEKAYTELKATQTQLIQSEKMASLGELTAGIAHEIQNPLNFVNNFSEVNTELIKEIQDERRKTKDQRDQALEDELLNNIRANEEKINHHGKRADAIVKGMLQHSRSSSGVKEPTDINALCDEYLRLTYHGLRAKDKSFNAEMKTDFDSSLPKVNIIPQDIGRVILNLLTNAFYVVNEKRQLNIPGYKPTVSLSTKRIGDKVEMRVTDNGNGIPQKVLDKIFQPFFTTKPTGQGTGLGLSLSYDIVKAHGGELKAETREGEGSTFIILLPLS